MTEGRLKGRELLKAERSKGMRFQVLAQILHILGVFALFLYCFQGF